MIQYIYNQIYINNKIMRPARNSIPKESPKQEVEISKSQKNYQPIICLKNSLEGIIKRIQCQMIARLVMHWGRYDKKIGKIKFISFFNQFFFRTKIKFAFEKLKRKKSQMNLLIKAANSFALICRRVVKNNIKLTFTKLKENSYKANKVVQPPSQYLSGKNPKQVSRGSRLSQDSIQSLQSNILSVSEDSENSVKLFIFDQNHDFTTQEVINLRLENQQLKKMTLNSSVRESLLKMQQFDRSRYNIDSERILKGPISSQLKRLQKMKNEHKDMHEKYYDNELTITCLYNYIKLINEMNQQLNNSNNFKNKISQLDQKMHRLSAEHRKQINQFQSKLVFTNYSQVKDQGRDNSINKKQAQKGNQKDTINYNADFTADEITTFNILLVSLRTKKYQDAKREIQHFVKQSKKQQIVILLKELMVIIQQIQITNESNKLKEKEKTELLSSISLLDKYLRTNKMDQLQKIKNKSKSVTVFNEFYAMTDTVFNLYGEVQRLRRKDSSSAEKDFKSAQKDRLKKTVQNQNEELKKELKNLQLKYQQLQNERNTLIENSKKNDRPRPSVSRKNTLEKELVSAADQSQNLQIIKRYQQNQLVLQKKIEAFQKQFAQINQKNKLKSDSLQKKYGDLQNEIEFHKTELSKLKTNLKQFEDGVKLYGMIQAKKPQKSYQRQMNEFRKYVPESIFFEFFQNLTARDESTNQVLLVQIKSIASLFVENKWKNKANILLNEQSEINIYINQIIQKLLSLLKQKEETSKINRQTQKEMDNLKKREVSANEENARIKEELNKLREESSKYKIEINKMKNEVDTKIKGRNSEPSNSNMINLQKQVSELRIQNQKLKMQISKSVNVDKKGVSQENNLRQKLKQFEEGTKYYETIKSKRAQRQQFQRQINQFKRRYPYSIFIDLFQKMAKEDSSILTLTNQIKTIANLFMENGWKRKQNILLNQQGEIYEHLNKIIQMLLLMSKEREQTVKSLKDKEKQIQNIKTKLTALTQQNQRFKEELSKAREEINKKGSENRLKDKIEDQKQLRAKVKQLQDGQFYYQKINIKINQNQSFQREIVQFKKQYSQSIFINIFQKILAVETTNQTIISHIKNIMPLFSNNGWKKKTNILIKQEGEIFAVLNQLIQKLLSFARQKQQSIKINLQQSKQIEGLKQNQVNLSQQNSSLKEQLQTLALQLSKATEEISIIKEQYSKLQNIGSSTIETSKINEMTSQNQKLRNEYEFISSANANLNKQIDIREQQLIQQLTRNQNNNNLYQLKIKELESLLINSDQKIVNLTTELKIINEETNNLKLMIEQQNQDYEIAREHVEIHEKDKQLTEQTIIKLKRNFQNSESQIQQIRMQVERLINERNNLSQEKTTLEINFIKELQISELKIKSMKTLLDQKQLNFLETQGKLDVVSISFKNQLLIQQSQKQFLSKQIAFKQTEISQLKSRIQYETTSLREKCNNLIKQFQQMKLSHEREKTVLIQQSKSMAAYSLPTTQNEQKLQLRKQLQLVNQEVTNFIKNNETQKRQMRRYIQKLTNDMQMQTILYTEQKKILREDVQRARNEEYQINYDKIKKLREDIQILREENQRLTSIIDTNETSFNKLIKEHQEMYQRSIYLQNQNQALHREIAGTLQQKDELMRKLQPLEDKLVIFQNKIAEALQEQLSSEQQQMKNSQSKVNELEILLNHLNEEKTYLLQTNQSQSRQLIEMHQQIIKMQAQLNYKNQAGSSPRVATNQSQQRAQSSSEEGERYSKHLQQKLKNQERELKRYSDNQKQLTNKVQRLMRNINDLERQKMEQQSTKRERDLQFALFQGNHQKQVFALSDKCRKIEESAFQYQKELAYWRGQFDILKEQLVQSQSNCQLIQQYRQKTAAQNNGLKIQVEDLSRQIYNVNQRMQQNKKLCLQNNLLMTKLTNSEQQSNQLLLKIKSLESQLLQIKKINEISSVDHKIESQNDFWKDRGIISQKEEEIIWIRGQLNQRDQEIHRIRSVQIDLNNSIINCQQQLHRLRQFQQKYMRESQMPQQLKKQFNNTILFYKSEIKFSKEREEENNRRLMQLNDQFDEVQRECKRLIEQNDRLQNEMTSVSPASRDKMDTQYLKQIALQLDYKYELCGEQQQIEIKILQKISQQISELTQLNHQLKIKCSSLQKQVYLNHTQICEEEFVTSLHRMVLDLLTFLKSQSLINPELSYFSAKECYFSSCKSSQRFILDIGIFFRDLIMQLSKSYEQDSIKNNSIIREIKLVIQEYLHTNNRDSLIKLNNMLNMMT